MYWILAAATILGGISALWFFWDKLKPNRSLNQNSVATPVLEVPARPLSEVEQRRNSIIAWKGKAVTVTQMNSGKAARLLGPVRSQSLAMLLDCTDLFVSVRVDDSIRSIPLRRLDISHDHENDRLELQERDE
jgi:hypothetical protein